jgi:predicted nucleic acid-binding protein
VSAAGNTLFVAEPPAHYQIQPPLVVDCSTLAGLIFHEPWHALALDGLRGRALHAPALLPFEIASVAAKKHRAGRADIATDGLLQFVAMAIALHPVDPAAALALALRYSLSTYDAAYLWLAAELKAPLATFDDKLAAAAQVHLAALP